MASIVPEACLCVTTHGQLVSGGLPFRQRNAGIRRSQGPAVIRNVTRMSIWENQGQFRARYSGPVADIAGIDVHEGQSRSGIKADAAAFFGEPRIAKLLQRNVREHEVRRLAGDMAAVLRLAAGGPPEHFVGGR